MVLCNLFLSNHFKIDKMSIVKIKFENSNELFFFKYVLIDFGIIYENILIYKLQVIFNL